MLYKTEKKLIITTSRKPSQITRRFTQFLKHYFNGEYITRGKTSFNKIINKAKEYDNSILIVITETKGNPSSINIYENEEQIASIYLSVSLPQNNTKVNTESSDIIFINKTKELNELYNLLTQIKSDEKIKTNCVLTESKDDNITATFIDKNAKKLDYKIYIKGFKLN